MQTSTVDLRSFRNNPPKSGQVKYLYLFHVKRHVSLNWLQMLAARGNRHPIQMWRKKSAKWELSEIMQDEALQ